MATMHFHIAQMSLFFRTFFRIQGGSREQFGINKKLSWGARLVELDTGEQRHIEYIEIAFCILAWSIFSHGINGS